MMDKSEQVRGKKSGKSKTRELLDNFVAKEIPRFGARLPPQDGWGRMGIERLKDDKKEDFSPPSREEFLSALKSFKRNKSVKNGDIPGFAISRGLTGSKITVMIPLFIFGSILRRSPKGGGLTK